jgi:hypothetical protein
MERRSNQSKLRLDQAILSPFFMQLLQSCKALLSFVAVAVVFVLYPNFMALLCLQRVQMLQNESVGRRMNFTKHFPGI